MLSLIDQDPTKETDRTGKDSFGVTPETTGSEDGVRNTEPGQVRKWSTKRENSELTEIFNLDPMLGLCGR